MTPASPDTCIHQPAGLCPDCQTDRDYDPAAWWEFGRHADGERRWAELQAEIADDATRPDCVAGGTDDSEIPF